jgi:tight adherence protein C
MALGLALAGLLSYYLLIRGMQMVRAQPNFDVDADFGAPQHVELPPERRSLVAGIYRVLGRWSGPSISQLLGPRWRLGVSKLLAAGGQPRGLDVPGFAELQGAYATLAVIGTLLMTVRGLAVFGVLTGVLLLAYPTVWLYSEAQRRQRQIEQELPDFLDILAITVTAGLGFRAAMERVGETLEGPLSEEIRRTLRRMDVGVRRRQAFVELRERNPRSATMGLFVTAIIQAEELGAPLADTLNQLAADMRREFSQQARRRAARAAPRVSLIITMIIMPAIVALIVVALFLGSDASLSGF